MSIQGSFRPLVNSVLERIHNKVSDLERTHNDKVTDLERAYKNKISELEADSSHLKTTQSFTFT